MIDIKLSYLADECTIKALIDIRISYVLKLVLQCPQDSNSGPPNLKSLMRGELYHKAMLLPNVTKLLTKLV